VFSVEISFRIQVDRGRCWLDVDAKEVGLMRWGGGGEVVENTCELTSDEFDVIYVSTRFGYDRV
jgi:hypothetical protein